MSYDTWSDRGNYLTKEQIIEIAPKEGKEFFEFFELNNIDEEEFGGLNGGAGPFLYDLIDNCELNTAQQEEIKEELIKRWESLKSIFKEDHNIVLDTCYPTGNYEGGDSQELYYCVENYYIINPDIDKDIIEKIDSFDVILGG